MLENQTRKARVYSERSSIEECKIYLASAGRKCPRNGVSHVMGKVFSSAKRSNRKL